MSHGNMSLSITLAVLLFVVSAYCEPDEGSGIEPPSEFCTVNNPHMVNFEFVNQTTLAWKTAVRTTPPVTDSFYIGVYSNQGLVRKIQAPTASFEFVHLPRETVAVTYELDAIYAAVLVSQNSDPSGFGPDVDLSVFTFWNTGYKDACVDIVQTPNLNCRSKYQILECQQPNSDSGHKTLSHNAISGLVFLAISIILCIIAVYVVRRRYYQPRVFAVNSFHTMEFDSLSFNTQSDDEDLLDLSSNA